MTPLHYAIETNLFAPITHLISHPAIVVNTADKYWRPPLRLAIEECKPEYFEALLAHKDISIPLKDVQDRTPLQITELLMEVACDKNYSNNKEQYEYITALLSPHVISGINSNSETGNVCEAFFRCYTFIHMIEMNDDSARLKYLLGNHMTNANLHDIHGLTLLLYVTQKRTLECLRIFHAQKDIHVNAQDAFGDPFFCTAWVNLRVLIFYHCY